jgi:hypothetical protein
MDIQKNDEYKWKGGEANDPVRSVIVIVATRSVASLPLIVIVARIGSSVVILVGNRFRLRRRVIVGAGFVVLLLGRLVLLLSGLVLVHGCQGVIEVDVKNEKKGNNE